MGNGGSGNGETRWNGEGQMKKGPGRRLKLSPALGAELAFVVQKLGALPSICDRCDARLDSYADRCTADLNDYCPGYLAIENAKLQFHWERKHDEAKSGT